MAKQQTDLDLVAKHKYRLSDGRIAVNVTAISGLMDDGKSSAMAGAAAKITREGGNYRKEWDAKAALGTRIHTHFETWLAGHEVDATPEDMPYLEGLAAAMVDHQIRPLEVESIMLSDSVGYGGRCDLFAITKGGRRMLIDLKTGKKYPTSQTLQLAAYRYADGIATYDANGMLASLRAVPEVDACACLFVQGDGSYELVEYPADPDAFGVFAELVDAYTFKKRIDKQFPYKKEAA